MTPVIEPSSFYGANRATLDLVRSIRLSRLTSAIGEAKSQEKKSSRSRSNSEKGLRVQKPKVKTFKLFPGISHGIKKSKKKVKKEVKERRGLTAKRAHIRQAMKEKFDFSRTPYALPKKPRVALNEENGQKRKFFKSTIHTEEPKKDNQPTSSAFDFDDVNDIDEEPFSEIKKHVSEIIPSLIDWSDDEDCMKPQLTRKKAVDITNENNHSVSYLAPMEKSPLPAIKLTPTTPTNLKNNDHNVSHLAPIDTSPLPAVVHTPTTPMNLKNKENMENHTKINSESKYYPIFTSPGSPNNVLSNVTNKLKKSKTDLIKAASPNDQYQIDAGQKIIGPMECKKCGMVYDIGDPVDEQRHRKFHENASELKFKSSKNENVVGYSGTDRIVLVQYSDSKSNIDKVHAILKQTEDEIGPGYSFGPCWKAFIYIKYGNVLGCVIAEPNIRAHRAIHSDGIILLSEDTYPVKCGINRIWVKREFRGQKIATEMMNCLRKNFIYGEYLKLDDIAFSVTTADGNEFAKKYTGREDYLTYSGSNLK